MVQDEVLKLKFDNSYGGKLFATQTDTGRTFTVQILSDRNDIIDVTGMSLRLYVGNQKEVTYCDGEIVDAGKGIFKLQLFNSQLKYPGIQQAQFILKKDDKKIGSKIFEMHIEEGVEAGSSMGTNLVIMYDDIKEAKEFLKDCDRTLEEAKKVDLSLKVGIKEGTDTREDLASCKKKALEIKSNLETTTTNAQNILNEAVGFKDEVENIKNTLVEENTKANSNLTNLDAKIADGKQTATNLENKTSVAKTTEGQLEQANTAASNTRQFLEATTSAANEAKTKLDNSTRIGNSVSNDLLDKISQGDTLNSNLATSISSANSAKSNLDGSISNAESTNTSLKATDTEAKKTENLIRDLMSQLNLTKDEVQGIIASGNLDQYITDPKLEEALKSYATKEDLLKIDVTSQLVDYAKKTEIPTKLSQLNNDKTFKTEIEIQTMINNSAKLKKEVVTSLPSSGVDDVVYLLKNKSDSNNVCTEYLWINGNWEIVGDTKVDLIDYAKKSEIKTKLSEMISDSTHRTVTDTEKKTWNNKVDAIEGKSLSSNDFTDVAKEKVDAIPLNPKYTDTVTRVLGKTGDITKEDFEGLGLGGISEDEVAAISWKLIYNDYIFNEANNLYNKLNLIAGTNFSPTIQTTKDLVSSEVAMKELANNKIALDYAFQSNAFINAMINSSVGINAFINSYNMLNLTTNSSFIMNILLESKKFIKIESTTNKSCWDNPYKLKDGQIPVYAYILSPTSDGKKPENAAILSIRVGSYAIPVDTLNAPIILGAKYKNTEIKVYYAGSYVLVFNG
ncbi:BppU family phage baseplate upper protein [Peptoniphilus raoultii]|uniref:BppU family phage baseplate upper protein n=1 Tax=Peptoniphilus raoultii TaxID=1776387 RepID=UPI0008DA6944|nr:BppU family phage baseplate upper protein [Peptoniphilus raoultii]